VEVKEVKMRPKIDTHDYETKKGLAVRFLTKSARVTVTIMFRGREMAHTELGRKLLDRLAGDLQELATVDAYPKLDGRNMVMVLAPVKRAVVKERPDDAEGEGGDREAAIEPEAAVEPESGPGAEESPQEPVEAQDEKVEG
jgi:translation initiation factor IF-3